MSNLILDYAVKFSQVTSLPAPSLGFLKSAGVVYLDPLAPIPSNGTMVVGERNGTDVIPATILLVGLFNAGDGFSFTMTRDVEGIMGGGITIADDSTAAEVAILLADYLNGNTGILATAVGDNVEIVATEPNTTIYIDGLGLDRYLAPNIQEVYTIEELQLAAPEISADVSGLFDAGLNNVFIISVASAADIRYQIQDQESTFFTLLNTSQFTSAEFIDNSFNWDGVRGISEISREIAAQYSGTENVCSFFHNETIPNFYQMFYAFGGFLASQSWRNQQYASCPVELGSVTQLGMAESLFNERVSFYINDTESGTRLGFFVCGGKSMTTPYVAKELELMMQFDMTNFLTINQPFNVAVERAELERIGNKRVIEYIDAGLLDPDGENTINVTDGVEVFTVKGNLTTSPAVALWRIFVDSYQTQG